MKRFELSLLGMSLTLSAVSFMWVPDAAGIAGLCVGASGMMVADSVRRGFYKIFG